MNRFEGVEMRVEQDASGWNVKYTVHYRGYVLHSGIVLGGRESNYGGIDKGKRDYILRRASEIVVGKGYSGVVVRKMK